MLRSLALTLAGAAMLVSSVAVAEAAPRIETEHIAADIEIRNIATRPGDSTDIAITHTIAPNWHTYWLNPGDSGEPPIADWTLKDGGTAGPLRFPAPNRMPYGPLMNFGYKDAFTLLASVTVPADWPVGTPYPVTLQMDWLVCYEICIPEGGEVDFSIPTGPETELDSAVAFDFVKAEWALPKASDAEATYTRDDHRIFLTVPLGTPENAAFFPLDRDVIDHVAEQTAIAAADGDGMTLQLESARGRLDGTLRGVLRTDEGSWWITAKGDPDPAPAAPATAQNTAGGGGGGTLAPLAPLQAANAASPATPAADLADTGLFRALLLAFAGGLILNLMPCVFPVLALKALGLIAHADAPFSRRAAIGGAYTAGILASFAVLAGVLLALKAGGVAIGWGFQLQSPTFVAVMALLVFAVGLNLSGVFEVGASLTRLGGSAAQRDGLAGSFATGALATIVATPCTAPFMAVAIGVAVAASAPFAFAVFLALGLGLATPFVLLSLVPGLARIMPKPGVWMVRLKQVLAFPLYATAAWLVWVLAQLVGIDALLSVFAAFVLLAFSAWLFGLSQRGTRASHRIASGLAALSLVGAGFVIWPATNAEPPNIALAATMGRAEPFSPMRLAELRGTERAVFVNVTAAWCITCKVNERVVFDDPDFARLLAENDITYLEADWTRRDPDITRYIGEFGRAGVPLYVFYPAGGEPEILPQILTMTKLDTTFTR
ncbi:thioredoxin family protein [Acuticoccus sp. M5D2P5]|uniref:protein-disulfide reductase DsbD family protein n=1 Tax=Acuticoccus kalidii TaxID=2910977 RepID=UPI001F292407|nr:thioredoxin family protein [Acuticoccus kalidii]MCF3932231.1 thioredoxin family protein [Acuticoccus kalidii]